MISEPDPSRRARGAALGEGLGEVITADPAAGPVTEVIDELTAGMGPTWRSNARATRAR